MEITAPRLLRAESPQASAPRERVDPSDTARVAAAVLDPDLDGALASAAENVVACYRQACRDLAHHSPLSHVGTAAELREVLTAVLHVLAPDGAVMAQAAGS